MLSFTHSHPNPRLLLLTPTSNIPGSSPGGAGEPDRGKPRVDYRHEQSGAHRACSVGSTIWIWRYLETEKSTFMAKLNPPMSRKQRLTSLLTRHIIFTRWDLKWAMRKLFWLLSAPLHCREGGGGEPDRSRTSTRSSRPVIIGFCILYTRDSGPWVRKRIISERREGGLFDNKLVKMKFMIYLSYAGIYTY